jgi:hypothetical protein
MTGKQMHDCTRTELNVRLLVFSGIFDDLTVPSLGNGFLGNLSTGIVDFFLKGQMKENIKMRMRLSFESLTLDHCCWQRALESSWSMVTTSVLNVLLP